LPGGGDNIFGKMSRGKLFILPKSGEVSENFPGNFPRKCNLPAISLRVDRKYPRGVPGKFRGTTLFDKKSRNFGNFWKFLENFWKNAPAEKNFGNFWKFLEKFSKIAKSWKFRGVKPYKKTNSRL
jgi:hypothetical protein